MPCVAMGMNVEACFRRVAPAAHKERSSRIDERVFEVFIVTLLFNHSKKQRFMKLNSINWREVLKVVLTILTAIAGSLGVVSCMG